VEKVPKFYETWHFGDTKKLSNDLVESVRTGQKTATSALVWELEAKGEKLPNVEDIAVVTNWERRSIMYNRANRNRGQAVW
jgi:uncharacterized protein YhfF